MQEEQGKSNADIKNPKFQAKLTKEWESMDPKDKSKYHRRTEAMRNAYFQSLVANDDQVVDTISIKERGIHQVNAMVTNANSDPASYVPAHNGGKSKNESSSMPYVPLANREPIRVKTGWNNETYVKVGCTQF